MSSLPPPGPAPFVRAAPLAVSLLVAVSAVAHAAPLDRQRLELELPGAPVAVVPSDLDGDGDVDLAILVAWTEWGQLSVEEQTTFSGIEGLVEVLTIVPSLFDRRELRAYLAEGGGRYREAGPPAEAPLDLLALDAGPPAAPLVALTDGGAVAYRLDAAGTLRPTPLVAARPVLAGSGVFLPGLELVTELSGDGRPDLVLPAADGLLVHLGDDAGFAVTASARVPLPGETWLSLPEGPRRQYPLPSVSDLDGDRLPDLVWRHPEEGWGLPAVARGLPGGRFAAPQRVATARTGWRPRHEREELERDRGEDQEAVTEGPVLIADLDGDGRAEMVSQRRVERDDLGLRGDIRQAESPPSTVRFHRLAADLAAAGPAYAELPIQGYAFALDSDFDLPGGLRDLDGDGRRDLVAMTFDIKVRKVMTAMVTKSMSLPVDFHVWCQGADGTFRAVTGLDLAGELKVDLDRFELRRMPSFSGDFDGDGRVDFVQLGRGREVSVHRGAPGCSFPSRADLVLRLRRAPAHLELVRVADLDGDQRADLMVIHPRAPDEAGESAPVTLELHLSGGGR